MASPAAASELYARVLAIEPEHDDALAHRSRLLLTAGDLGGAANALVQRRDHSEGVQRVALDLELASLYLDRLDRPEDALAAAASVLEGNPTEAQALQIVERAL